MRTDTLRATSSPNHTKSSLTPAYAARVLRGLLHLCGAKAHARKTSRNADPPLPFSLTYNDVLSILRARDAPPLCAVATDPRADVRTKSEPI